MNLFVSSLILGIAFCAPPGIVTIEAVRRGMARGFWATLQVELGSLIGDATWAIIALVGLAFLVQNGPARVILGSLGTLFLFYLAWSAFREAKKGGIPETKPSNRQGDFSTGAFLSLGNPFTVAFWLGVGSSTITTSVPDPEWIHFVVFFLAFMLGALIWCFILAGLVVWGRRFVTPVFFRWVNVVCGLLLGYFGIELFLKNLAGFF
jgi:chemosensory pili system protein ChpE